MIDLDKKRMVLHENKEKLLRKLILKYAGLENEEKELEGDLETIKRYRDKMVAHRENPWETKTSVIFPTLERGMKMVYGLVSMILKILSVKSFEIKDKGEIIGINFNYTEIGDFNEVIDDLKNKFINSLPDLVRKMPGKSGISS